MNKERAEKLLATIGIKPSQLSSYLGSRANIPQSSSKSNPSAKNISDSGKAKDITGPKSKDDTILDDEDDERLLFTDDGDLSFENVAPTLGNSIDVQRLIEEQGADQAVYTLTNAAALDDIRHIHDHFKQESVMLSEVYKIYDIISNYDFVELNVSPKGVKKLVFDKSYPNADYRTVEIASNKSASLDLVTIFITKNNIKGSQSVPSATVSSSLQRGSASSIDSVSQTTQNSNPSQQNNSDSGKKNDITGPKSKDDTILDDEDDERLLFTDDGDLSFENAAPTLGNSIDVQRHDRRTAQRKTPRH